MHRDTLLGMVHFFRQFRTTSHTYTQFFCLSIRFQTPLDNKITSKILLADFLLGARVATVVAKGEPYQQVAFDSLCEIATISYHEYLIL